MPSATAWNNIAEVPGAPPDNDCLTLIPSNLEVMEIVLGERALWQATQRKCAKNI